MTRLLIFAVLVLVLGYGFSWLADRPGDLSLVWGGELYQTKLIVAAGILIALIAAVMVVWWFIRLIWTSPHSVTRYFRARKRDRGYQALSTGLIAAGAGNALLARKMAARTRGLIRADQEPLINLLEAQAALIEGKHDEARQKIRVNGQRPGNSRARPARPLSRSQAPRRARGRAAICRKGGRPGPISLGQRKRRWNTAVRPVIGTKPSSF